MASRSTSHDALSGVASSGTATLSGGGNGRASVAAADAYQQLVALIEDEARHNAVSMNLSGRQLTKLPHEIGLAMSLERLGLSSNALSSLPPEFGRLISLQYLNLRSNSLREFPAVLTTLQSLEIIDLSRNKIKKFPEELGALVNLKVLSVAKNRIQVLPTYIRNMRKLTVFKIEHNPIQWPPPNVYSCPQDVAHEDWIESLRQYMNDEVAAGVVVGESQSGSQLPSSISQQQQHGERSHGRRLSVPSRTEGIPTSTSHNSLTNRGSRDSYDGGDAGGLPNDGNHSRRIGDHQHQQQQQNQQQNQLFLSSNNANGIDIHGQNQLGYHPQTRQNSGYGLDSNAESELQKLGMIAGSSEQAVRCSTLLSRIGAEYDTQTLQWIEIAESTSNLLDMISDAINDGASSKLNNSIEPHIAALAMDPENVAAIQTALTGLDRERRFLDSAVTACSAFVSFHGSLARLLEDYQVAIRRAQSDSHKRQTSVSTEGNEPPKFGSLASTASLISIRSGAVSSYAGALRALSSQSSSPSLESATAPNGTQSSNNNNGSNSSASSTAAKVVSQAAESLSVELGDLGRAVIVLETSILEALDTIRSFSEGAVDGQSSNQNSQAPTDPSQIKLPPWTKSVRSALLACTSRSKRLATSFVNTLDTLCNALVDRQIRELVKSVFDSSSDLSLAVVWAFYAGGSKSLPEGFLLQQSTTDYLNGGSGGVGVGISTEGGTGSMGSGLAEGDQQQQQQQQQQQVIDHVSNDSDEQMSRLKSMSQTVSITAKELVVLFENSTSTRQDSELAETVQRVADAAQQLLSEDTWDGSDDSTLRQRMSDVNRFIRAITRMTSQARQHSIRFQAMEKDVVAKLQEVTKGTKELALMVGDIAKSAPSSRSTRSGRTR